MAKMTTFSMLFQKSMHPSISSIDHSEKPIAGSPMIKSRNLQLHVINLNDYQVMQKIDGGGLGIVYLVNNKTEQQQQLAAKVNLRSTSSRKDIDKSISREISILSRARSPTLVQFYGISLTDFDHNPNVTVLMEYISNGTLKRLIEEENQGRSPHEYDNTAKQIILCGIAHGMMILHSRGVIHRDLKPDNVLLDSNFHPHITNFGFCKFLDSDNSKSQYMAGCGTPGYIAPEVLKSNQYGPKADVYSFGILMFEVIMGHRAFPELFEKKPPIYFSFVSSIIQGKRPKFDRPIKRSLKLLIERCWSSNPKERPTFRELFHKLSFQLEDDDDTIETHLHDLVSEEHNSNDEENDDEEDEYSRYCLPGVDFDCVLDYIDEITSSKTKENQHQQSNEKETKYIKESEEETTKYIEVLEKQHQIDKEQIEKNKQQIEVLTAQLFRMNVQLARVIKSQSKSIAKPPVIDLDDFDFEDIKGNNDIKKAIHRQTQKCFVLHLYSGQTGHLEKIFDGLLSLYPLVIPGVQEFYGYRYPLSESDKQKLNIYPFDSAGFILTDFLQFKSLDDYIVNYHKGIDKDKFNSTRRTKIIFGIAAIMKKLHQHNVIHHILSPSEILLDENLEPLINYFDIQTVIPYPNDEEFSIRSPFYLAPEMFMDGQDDIGFPVDVYSFGLIIFKMFVQNVQFDTKKQIRSTQQLMMNIGRGKRPIRDSCIPDCYWQLIERCWKQKPEERPTFDEITEILKDDQYVLHDCGEPDLNEIHLYQHEIDN